MNTTIHTAIAPHIEEETKHKQSTDLNGNLAVSSIPQKSKTSKYNDPLLSREELAERWGLCIETLKRWEKSGKLSFLKIGKQVRYRLSAVEEIEFGSEVLL
jgi:excisionase family DNA binding protein